MPAMMRRRQSLFLILVAGCMMAAPVSIHLVSTSYWGGVLGVVFAALASGIGAFWVARRSGWRALGSAALIVALSYFFASLPILIVNEALSQGSANPMTAVVSSVLIAVIVSVQVLISDATPALVATIGATALIWTAQKRQSE